MKIIITISLLINILFSSTLTMKDLKDQYNRLSTTQIDTMIYVYNFGLKHDLEWTLTAIAWKESEFGLLKLPLDNLLDRGLMQINLKTYFKRHGIKNTRWNRSKYGTMLVVNDDNNLLAAIDEIRFWESIKPKYSGYRFVWKGYNGGYSNSKRSIAYAADIALRIKFLRTIILTRDKKINIQG